MSPPGVFAALRILLARELRLAVRRWSEALNPLLFFLVVITLFPLALTPAPELLARLAPGVVWVAALLATLLGQEAVFRGDYEDGTLEQLALAPQPLWLIVLAKLSAHWFVTGLPLVVIAPFAGIALALPEQALATMILALALGTPTLSLVGGIGAALTVSLHRGGVLLAVLVLPLLVPVLIFGARATDMAASGLSPSGPLYLLGALLALAVALAPFAGAAALRVHLD